MNTPDKSPSPDFTRHPSLTRITSLMKKEFRQFFRNIALVAIVFFAVVLDPYSAGQMTLDLRNFRTAVLDLDKTVSSVELIDKLRPPYFAVVRSLTSFDQAHQMLVEGSAGMVLVIPEGFQRKLSGEKTARVQVIFDGTESNSATIGVSYLGSIVEQFSREIIIDKWDLGNGALASVPSIDPRTRVLYNANLHDDWFLVLAEFLNAITLISILLPAAATVYEKQTGTLEQLVVTPSRVTEIMIAKVLPMTLVIMGSVYIGVFFTLQTLVGVPLRGSLLYFTLVTIVFLFSTTGLGMLVATIASDLSETILVTIIILIPLVFLSGSYTPPEAMPGWMQFLIHFSPLKYYLDICYGIFLRGVGFAETWDALLIMGALGLGIFLTGGYRLRRSFS